MINVRLDTSGLTAEIRKQIQDAIAEADAGLVFWDMRELERRTCMSVNFIKEMFFFDPGFPRRKVGSKWYFPAKETREFLERWLDQQSAS